MPEILSNELKKNPLQSLSKVVNMLPITIRSPPALEEFVSLEEYQSGTPESFFDGKPVLHHHVQGAKVLVPRSQTGFLPLFAGPGVTEASVALSNKEQDPVEVVADLFVSSEYFTIFSEAAAVGVCIPYPTIGLHAIETAPRLADKSIDFQVMWMYLGLTENDGTDNDVDEIFLSIVPPAASNIQTLYNALCACSDLHPDPLADSEDDDEDHDRIVFEGDHEPLEGFTGVMRGNADGGLPPPFPGSSGWITAENMHEHFDEQGNFIGNGGGGGNGGELGEGAGRVRAHGELNGQDEPQKEDAESKRARVEDPTTS